MQENDYDHNIRIRVEKKAEMYLKQLNKDVVICEFCDAQIKNKPKYYDCGNCGEITIGNNS